ncbi:MAG TPA: glycosyltransferase family 9 protein, partial [Rhodospirillales bacterium]|nr:glycosyltransferase family 9 protein [Rhodospirillales bacterium]
MGQTLTNLIDRFDIWRSKSTAFSEGRNGVLLISSGGIGDTLLFRLIILRFQTLLLPNEQLHLVIRQDCSQVAFLFPKDIQIHSIDYPHFIKNLTYRRTVCRKMHALNLRIAVSTDHLRHPLIDDVIVRATLAPQKFALYPRSWPKYDTLLKRNIKQYDPLIEVPDHMEHRLIRWWHLANEICGDVQPVPKASLPKAALPPPAHLERDLFMLHPFSAVKERQYSVKIFQEILEILPLDCDIALSCGPEDLTTNPEFKMLLDDARVYVDMCSFEYRASTLQATKLVISIDTSVMHLATLCGTPTICLASAAHVIDSIPYDERMIPKNVCFLYHDMECRMCLGQCSHPLEDNRYPCIAR